RADEFDAVQRERGRERAREELADQKIQRGDLADMCLRVRNRENAAAHRVFVRNRGGGDDAQFGVVDVDNGNIDAIYRRAADEPGDPHERFSSCCRSCSSCSASMGRSRSTSTERMRSAM